EALDLAVREQVREEPAGECHDRRGGDRGGEAVAPVSGSSPRARGDGEEEDPEVERRTVELGEDGLRVGAPEDGGERPERERGQEACGDERPPVGAREGPEAERDAEPERPPDGDREPRAAREAEAPAVVGEPE